MIGEPTISTERRLTILASFVMPAAAMQGIALSRRQYPPFNQDQSAGDVQ